MLSDNYTKLVTDRNIYEEYDSYINGLYDRKSKPWLISKTDGIEIINGTRSICYSWKTIQEDVKGLKILKRRYYKSQLTLDDQIWQSFICLGQDIWELEDAIDTYGITTIDGYTMDWESYKNMVFEGLYEVTTERIEHLKPYEEEVVDNTIDGTWYESIEN